MPARLRALIAAGEKLGVAFEEPKSGGAHWKATKPGFRPYTVPAHNGTKSEITDDYIRGMCRALGVDYAELKALL